MLRPFHVLTWLCLAPAGLVAAQVSPPDCDPCPTPGRCAATHPIVSSSVHYCEDHGGHNHSGANVSGVNMGRASLAGGNLSGSVWLMCDFSGANLGTCNASNASFVGSVAESINLINADCSGADFGAAGLEKALCFGTDFNGASLVGTSFRDGQLNGADFTAATLSSGPESADFSGANLTDAVGLDNTVGIARYSASTNFSGTGFDPVAAGWVLDTEELLFFDNFESGNFTAGGWVKNNANGPQVRIEAAYKGSQGARVRKKAWIEKSLDTTGYEDIRIVYWRRTANYDGGEELRVRWWNGASWTTLENTTDEQWTRVEFALPAGADDNPAFKLRFKSRGDQAKERGEIDNVEIHGTPL